MTTVKLRQGESQESLLKRFRKDMGKARILRTVCARKDGLYPEVSCVAKQKGKASEKLSESPHERERDSDGKDQDFG